VVYLTTDFHNLFFWLFLISAYFSFLFSFEGFGLVPAPTLHAPFFNKISRVWRHKMEVAQSGNLVGMSMLPLNVCLLSLLIKKKLSINILI